MRSDRFFKKINPIKNVLLVIPALERDFFSGSSVNLGIGYVGAALRAYGYDVDVFDMRLSKSGFEELNAVIRQCDPQVVGITGLSAHHQSIGEVAGFIKQTRPDICTVLGGVHATALGEFILETNRNIDFVIKGEGELSFPRFLSVIKNPERYGDISGLVYRMNGRIISNAVTYIENLDSLDYPWTIIDLHNYQGERVHGFVRRALPLAQVVSSRGCPYQCTFCAGRNVLGSTIRLRSPDAFVAELEYLKSAHGVKEFQIVDDNFTFHKKHAVEVCEKIIEKKLNLFWGLPNGVRADCLDGDLLKIMKRAGCYYLSFGIEFGSERMLKICKKSLNLAKAKENIKIANRLGLITQGFFLMGHPLEKKEDIELTREFIFSAPFDKILLTLPFPVPGSELFSYYLHQKFGSVQNIVWDDFDFVDFERIFEYIDMRYLKRIRRRTYVEFYMNPVNIIRHLSKFRSWQQFKCAFSGFRFLCNLAK